MKVSVVFQACINIAISQGVRAVVDSMNGTARDHVIIEELVNCHYKGTLTKEALFSQYRFAPGQGYDGKTDGNVIRDFIILFGIDYGYFESESDIQEYLL